MPSYDCTTCDISYPASRGGGNCPVCAELTVWNYVGTPDDDWEEAMNLANGVIPPPAALPYIDRDYITKSFGQSWIAGAVLEREGYPDAQELDIIRVKGKVKDVYFELVGKTKADIPGTMVKGWMVTRVDWDGAAKDLTPEMFVGGG